MLLQHSFFLFASIILRNVLKVLQKEGVPLRCDTPSDSYRYQELKQALLTIVNVGDAVVQLSQLTTVPTVGGSNKIAGDALQFVDVRTSALRTNFQIGLSIFVAAVHTAVAVVVH